MTDIYKSMKKEVDDMMSKFDKDGDEVITKQEALDYFRSIGSEFPERKVYLLFEEFDTDNDGEISIDEIQMEVFAKSKKEIKEHNIKEDIATFLMKYDTNKDNSVSFDEMLKEFESSGSYDPKRSTESVFSKIDSDGDKIITYKELEEYFKNAFGRSGPSQ